MVKLHKALKIIIKAYVPYNVKKIIIINHKKITYFNFEMHSPSFHAIFY